MSDFKTYNPNLQNVSYSFDLGDKKEETGIIEGAVAYFQNNSLYSSLEAQRASIANAGFEEEIDDETYKSYTQGLGSDYEWLYDDARNSQDLATLTAQARVYEQNDTKLANMSAPKRVFASILGEAASVENYALAATGYYGLATKGTLMAKTIMTGLSVGAEARGIEYLRASGHQHITEDEIDEATLYAAGFGAGMASLGGIVGKLTAKNKANQISQIKNSITKGTEALEANIKTIDELEAKPVKNDEDIALIEELKTENVKIAVETKYNIITGVPKFDLADTADTALAKNNEFIEGYIKPFNEADNLLSKIMTKGAKYFSGGEYLTSQAHSPTAQRFGAAAAPRASWGKKVVAPINAATRKDQLQHNFDGGLKHFLIGRGGIIGNKTVSVGVFEKSFQRYKKLNKGGEPLNAQEFIGEFSKRALKVLDNPDKLDDMKFGDPKLDAMLEETIQRMASSRGKVAKALQAVYPDVKLHDNYVATLFNNNAIKNAVREKGKENVEALISKAYKSGATRAGEELTEQQANWIARGIVYRASNDMRSVNVNQVVKTKDFEEFAESLKRANDDITDEQINELISGLKKEQSEKSRSGRLQRKLQLDLDTKSDDWEILDLMEHSLDHYSNKVNEGMSGVISLKEIVGVDSADHFNRIIKDVKKEMKGQPQKEIDYTVSAMEGIYKQLQGIPIYQPTDAVSKTLVGALDTAKGVSFIMNMGLTQFSQFMEFAPIIGKQGLIPFIEQNMDKGFSKLLKKSVKGELDVEEAEYMVEAFGGFRHDVMQNQRFRDQEIDARELYSGAGKTLNKTIEHGKEAVLLLSTQAQLGQGQNYMALQAMNHEIYNAALKIKAGKNISLNRFHEVGLSKDDVVAIGEQMIKYGQTKKSPLTRINYVNNSGMHKWDNLELREKAVFAYNTGINQMVQRNFVGETSHWLTHPALGANTQFQGFMMAAINKKSVRAARQADLQLLASVAYYIPLGLMAISAKNRLAYAADGDKERYEQSMHPAQLAMTLIQYSPEISGSNMGIGAILDSVTNDYDTLYNKQEGIPTPSEILGNTPAMQSVDKIAKAGGAIIKNVGMAVTDPLMDYDSYNGPFQGKEDRRAISAAMPNALFINKLLRRWVDDGE